jgi:aspartyl/glutamyl-tRNA(Asn/Gln) amidotransferase C subunit
MKKLITRETVSKMVKLSNLNVDKKEENYFTKQFNETLATIDNLNKLDTKNINETSHVTGLSNVFREDIIEKSRMLSQKDALANGKKIYNGYFLVKAIFEE